MKVDIAFCQRCYRTHRVGPCEEAEFESEPEKQLPVVKSDSVPPAALKNRTVGSRKKTVGAELDGLSREALERRLVATEKKLAEMRAKSTARTRRYRKKRRRLTKGKDSLTQKVSRPE